MATQTFIRPPQLFKEIERASCHQQQSSTGYGGDYGIVSGRDDFYQEPFYDHIIQLSDEDPCLQSTDETIDQGYCYDDSICIDEAWDNEYDHVVYSEDEYEFSASDISEEQELITDISVDASDSLYYDTDGNIYGY